MSEKDLIQIKLQSVADIASVGDLKEQLTSALAAGQSISINANDVERIDAATLQLLLAFFRAAEAKQLSCNWASVSGAVRDAARLCGLGECIGLAEAV